MMETLFFLMAVLGGFCLLLGVVYPLVAILFYPIYRRLGGRDSLREYVKSL